MGANSDVETNRSEKNTPFRVFIDRIEQEKFFGKFEGIVQDGVVVRWEEKKMHLADEYLKK